MKAILHILQTGALSVLFVLLIKIVSIIRVVWLKNAIRIREHYNEKKGLPSKYGIEEIDTSSVSYQVDTVEGVVAAVCLFLLGGLLTLFLPIPDSRLFSIIAIILSIMEFLYCWFSRYTGTKKYSILVCVSCFVSVFLFIHALYCLFWDTVLLVTYPNSIKTIFYIWSTMIMYRLILDKKRKEAE